jgi:hypothetical protein
MTVNEMLELLLVLKVQGYGDLKVITDMEVNIIGVEYSDENDDPAIVLATDA